MNVESGFFDKNASSALGKEYTDFTGLQPLSSSKTGFFRLFVAKHLGRKVVLKTLKEEYSDNRLATIQLRKEFNAQFPISSNNVAQALSLIEIDGGAPAIEMEWCDGADIRTLLNQNLSTDDASTIIRGVLSGLMDIHSQGIVHRDIKPENVMYDPFRKVVKIIDFGCAYLTGSIMLQGPNGTEGYTPDEKTETGTEPEPKDDLYALGVMIAEMAERIDDRSKNHLAFTKKIKNFSALLKSGKYATTPEALAAFEQSLPGNRNPWWLIPLLFFIILVTGIIWFIYQSRRNTTAPTAPTSPVSKSAQPTTPDEIQIDLPDETAAKSTDESAPPASPRPGDKPIEKNLSETSRPESGAPVISNSPGISDNKDEIFNLVFHAGDLLRKAEAEDAEPGIKMDAFVIEFCDSIYQADNLWWEYPRYMSEQDMKKTAAKLRSKYKKEMERKFQKHFGSDGDRQRNELILEWRFYLSFQSYHHDPHYKNRPGGGLMKRPENL